MKNLLKKLFLSAGILGCGFVLYHLENSVKAEYTTLDVNAGIHLGAENYSMELQGAYQYAHTKNITTQSSIENADMMGLLLRSAMAKMIVNYATTVLGKTPDTTLSCNFMDIMNETTDMQMYIKLACQLGLMGQGISSFNPNGKVTRAEFGTVLSRALYGMANNGGNPYYMKHLRALKNDGIMKDISMPNAHEIRGYVMLMMERADQGETSTATVSTQNVVQVSSTSLGKIIGATGGMTLYVFGADVAGTSNCYGQCAINWPPLLVSNGMKPMGQGITAALSTTQRTDGSMQVTVNGMPVYFFMRDMAAGDVNGQGKFAFSGTWYVVSPAGQIITTAQTTGY